MRPSPSPVLPGIPAAAFQKWTQTILIRAGLPRDDAALAAVTLIDADRRGLATHGLARLSGYVEALATGALNPVPALRIETTGDLLRIDGDLGLGAVVAHRAIAAALDSLGDRGARIFLLSRAGHLGALGAYVRAAAAAGKVALLAQVTQPVMAPPGAAGAAIGNNPIALAAPMPDGGEPLVIDLSLSTVARGHVLLAAREGRPFPADWAIGRDGQPTTDPAEAALGAMRPMADHKGLALAMAVQILAGSLTGSRPAVAAPGQGGAVGVGAFGLVIDPARAIGTEAFAADIATWTRHYLAATAPAGRLPGRLPPADRIVPPPAILPELTALSARFDLPLPRGDAEDER